MNPEQEQFRSSLHDLLTASDVPAVARAWATGSYDSGLALWRKLADLGVTALAIPPEFDGLGATATDMVVALEELGHHAIPGPAIETIAVIPSLLSAASPANAQHPASHRPAAPQAAVATLPGVTASSGPADADLGLLAAEWLPRLASGDALATLAWPPHVPYAVDTAVAALPLGGVAGKAIPSVDPTRRLATVDGAPDPMTASHGSVAALAIAQGAADAPSIGPDSVASPGSGSFGGSAMMRGAGVSMGADSVATSPGSGSLGGGAAFDMGALACAAQLVGCGQAILEQSVLYVQQRVQFGQSIGRFQAVKHHLADVRIALDFARPLVYFAAESLTPQDISAAKVAASEAANIAARVGLQVHGAIGYTQECDLSLWLVKVRALIPAWGTPSWHRTRLMETL